MSNAAGKAGGVQFILNTATDQYSTGPSSHAKGFSVRTMYMCVYHCWRSLACSSLTARKLPFVLWNHIILSTIDPPIFGALFADAEAGINFAPTVFYYGKTNHHIAYHCHGEFVVICGDDCGYILKLRCVYASHNLFRLAISTCVYT